LTANDWPQTHSARGTWIWAPPPASAGAALQWMGNSIHKRLSSVHVFITPWLMTNLWRKMLNKTCDMLVELPAGPGVWKKCQHEPLILAIFLPLSRNSPWQNKGTRRVETAGQAVSSLWKGTFNNVGAILRKLLREARDLSSV
jgi:hypothetical protein